MQVDWPSVVANALPTIVIAVTAGYISGMEKRLELLMEKKIGEAMAAHREWMNGKYLRTTEQLKDNERFDERLSHHDERLNDYSVRIRDLEHRRAAGA